MPSTNTSRPRLAWPLLPIPDGRGRLSYPTLEASIRQTIEAILRTRPGERLMRPAFGGGLAEFLHEPNTLLTRRRIHDRIKESLVNWESRVQVVRLDVAEVPDEPAKLRVTIVYRLHRTGTVEQLGLTLSLQ